MINHRQMIKSICPYRIFRCGSFAILSLFLFTVALTAPLTASAEEIIEPPKAFILRAFDNDPPQPQALWLTPALQGDIVKILGHKVKRLRQRYWQKDNRTVWILEEIGKEQPITAGFIVDKGEIESVHLLIYRESRGWEIRYPYFRRQFAESQLDKDLRLDKQIDGISGATLSVHAMERMARLALLYHKAVTQPESRTP